MQMIWNGTLLQLVLASTPLALAIFIVSKRVLAKKSLHDWMTVGFLIAVLFADAFYLLWIYAMQFYIPIILTGFYLLGLAFIRVQMFCLIAAYLLPAGLRWWRDSRGK